MLTATEVNARMREVLMHAQVHTLMPDIRALQALGFSARTAFDMLEATILARDEHHV